MRCQPLPKGPEQGNEPFRLQTDLPQEAVVAQSPRVEDAIFFTVHWCHHHTGMVPYLYHVGNGPPRVARFRIMFFIHINTTV